VKLKVEKPWYRKLELRKIQMLWGTEILIRTPQKIEQLKHCGAIAAVFEY
jgi:hypothetical protein